MAGTHFDGFVLTSVWTGDTYRLTLTNRTASPLRDWRLGISGPGRLGDSAVLSGGGIVTQLSTYCEIAPESGLLLHPGASWTVSITHLAFPLRHWTDGAVSGFVIRADGTAVPTLTPPPTPAPHRRGTVSLPIPADPPVPVSIIPWPREVAVSGRRTTPSGLALMGSDPQSEAVADSFSALTQFLFPGEGIVREDEEGGYPVDLAFDDSLAEEAYAIAFEPDGCEVTGGSEKGLLYGLVTLGQMQRGARLHPESFSFPTGGHITDAPEMGWRGCHLDVARRLYSGEELKQFIAILAWNKLNTFHWHLNDDEAWRVEIEAYPELTDTAAWRGYGMEIPPLLGSGPEPSGGWYSKDAIRDIVDLAADFGVDVVPEIDMPGHCFALLQALPQLRDPGESGLYHSVQGFPNNCLNPAVEAVYPVVETILSELIELFPSRYFHIGADEVPADAWATSPKARAMGEKLGAPGPAPLQAHFLQRVQAFLSAEGKITGAWEEAAQAGGIEKANSYLVGWHTVEASQRLAAEGYDVVVSPGQAYYLDMANSEDWHECGAGWAGWSSPETTYAFDPSAGWSKAERKRLMGVQACIWSEPMSDRAVFDRLVFPRLSAIAETAWTAPERKDFSRFSALAGLMPNLYGQHE